ncbi:MAG: leucine-rich repeat protein [Clostridiales bacterium]|nr:leucine-rich repeat protein [Clostridiales bacterium]
MALILIFMGLRPINTDAASTVASGTCGDDLTWVLDDEGTLTISGTGEMESYGRAYMVPWNYEYSDSIKKVVIEYGVTNIGDYAFDSCNFLKEIVIPDSVTSIGSLAFQNCYSLMEIVMPDSLTSIGNGAFVYCSNLKSVTIGSGLSSLGYGSFGNNYSLTTITISEENCYFKAVSNVVFSKDGTTLYLFPGGVDGTYTIPDGVTSIYNYAFEDCTSLTKITIPDTVMEISYGAFWGCTSLTDMTIPGSVTNIGDLAFESCSGLTDMKIEDGVESIGESVFYKCEELIRITIPESTTSIGSSAFNYCSDLKYVYYAGSESQWTAIEIGSSNSYLTDATIYYNNFGPIDISGFSASLSSTSYTYDGSAKKPTVSITNGSTVLIQETDYTVSYSDNTDAGTATVTLAGMGLYSGIITRKYTINARDFSTCTISLSSSTYTYNGSEKKPTVTVKNGSTKLTKGTHYTVSYSNNSNAGTATVTIKGKGNYTGTVKKTFTISKAKNTITASDITKSYSKKKQSFSLKVKRKGSAALTYSSNNSKISINSGGKISVKKKYMGTATIKITAAATKNYKKTTKKITITVGPAKTSISSLTSGSGKIKATWKKVASCDGYEVYISSTSNFKKNIRHETGITQNSVSVKGMSSGTTYYVKVRAYKKVGKKTYYAPWSEAQSIQTK